MGQVIVDTSVTIAWLLADEPLHLIASALHEDMAAGAVEPIVAAHHGFEVRHALARAARRTRCSWNVIPAFLTAVHDMNLGVAATEAEDDLVYGLCRDLRLSWGDSLWVTLAKRLDLPLVTADMRLVRSVPPKIAWVEPLSSRPA